MKIGDYLQSVQQTVVTCRPDETAREAAERLKVHGIGAMPVMSDDGKLVGMISERDLANGFSSHGARLADMKVRDLLAKRVIFMGPGAKMRHALQTMFDHGFRHVPIVAEGKLIGIVSIRDVLAHVVHKTGFSTATEPELALG